ncbi:aldo/keto reductase, partial [bacterium]|nr:aldo/keto reductase [bacterium]
MFAELGRTGRQVSRIGLGLGLGGRSSRLSVVDGFREAVIAAIDSGVNHFDTAEIYGAGQSEEILGEFASELKDYGYVSTKISPSNFSAKELVGSVDRSLSRLRLEQIDLAYLHWPNPSIPIEETLAGASAALQSGKLQSLGLSNFPISGVKEIIETLGMGKITAIQCEYNLFDRSAEQDFIPFCKEMGIAFVAYSPLDQGRFCANPEQLEILEGIALSTGCTVAQLVLAWLAKKSPAFLIPATSSGA